MYKSERSFTGPWEPTSGYVTEESGIPSPQKVLSDNILSGRHGAPWMPPLF